MHTSNKTYIVCFFFISFFFLSVYAGEVYAQGGDAEALFRRGLVLFKQGKYVSAGLDFKEIVNNHGSTLWAYPAHMMIAKTYFNLGDFKLAESTAVDLRNRHPKGLYAEWSHYFTAACKFKTGEVNQAASILAELVQETKDKELKSRSLSALKASISPVIEHEIFLKILEDHEIKQSELDEVKPFDSSVSHAKSDDLYLDSSPFKRTRVWETDSHFKIGLLSPLTGINSDLGIQLLKGVRTALESNTLAKELPVELIVEDTESDPVTAVLKTRKLIEAGVVVIIGPVLSESTIAAATESQVYGIPFLAPTATNNGLTRLGKYVFQLNFNPGIQARALADYAINTLDFSNFAVIASNDIWGITVADTFSREMEKQGAVSIWTESLNPDISMTNHEILMNIREHAPESESSMDSLVVIYHGNAFPDTLILEKNPFLRGERKLGPVDSINCILVSATSEDAIQISSQIMEYNISTVILGDYGWWSNENAFEGSERYIEGAYVIAPAGELSGGLGLSYFNEVSRPPETRDIPLMKGADALNLILYCIERGASDPDELVGLLESVKDFQGVASRITIDPENHTNTAVEIIRVEDGRYVPSDTARNDSMYRNKNSYAEGSPEIIENIIPTGP